MDEPMHTSSIWYVMPGVAVTVALARNVNTLSITSKSENIFDTNRANQKLRVSAYRLRLDNVTRATVAAGYVELHWCGSGRAVAYYVACSIGYGVTWACERC